MKKSYNDSGLAVKRSHRRFIAGLTALAVSLALQAQDFARLSERSLIGTARYVGMSGAMTAIGGDPSSVLDNPAGLGMYQRMEALVTFDEALDYTRQLNGSGKAQQAVFAFPHASLVISVPTTGATEVLFHNFMFSYQRVHSYYRNWSGVGANENSLGAMLNTPDINWDIDFCTLRTNTANALSLKESGYVNEYTFDWASNIDDRWYVGAGLRVQSFALSSGGDYKETFDLTNASGSAYYNRNVTLLDFSGVTCSFSAGLIWRPTGWLRLGAGIHTPSLGSVTTFTSGTFSSLTDSLRMSYAADSRSNDNTFHMPLRTSASVAFQIGAYGMVALQYDYRHPIATGTPDEHSLRAGLEFIPVMGMYINAGYACESSFSRNAVVVPMDASFARQDTYFLQPHWTQYASVALGYRGEHVIVQAAYQYRWQQISLWAHEGVNSPYDIHSDTHRIVLTLGWHKN